MRFRLDTEKYLKELEFLVDIDSGSHDPEGVARVAAFFEAQFAELGWQVRRKSFGPALGPGLDILGPGCGEQQCDVLLLGHMDTVFPAGTTARRPFRIADGRAYGPGVIDMKSGCLYALHAARSLAAAGGRMPALRVVLNSHEEIGSVPARPWIEEIAVGSRYALVLEPARANGNFVDERRGSSRYAIAFRGKAAHSGVDPEKGASAINELAHWIVALHGLTDYARGLNLNAGLVSGGTAVNVVADAAAMELDVRLKTIEQADRVQSRLDAMRLRPFTEGVSVEVKGGLTRPPMNPTEATRALRSRVDAVADRLGVKIGWQATGGGSDGAFTAARGVPTIDGMGPVGGGAHSDGEYLELGSLAERFALLVEVLCDLAED
ncbi:Peptidase M20 [uncultured Alphaproteobacteria bacterium]|uniref:Peptidase M20 n=1 Tax=uncultured Alphaproteobacteria bacterium TaxID=91750 RepID=A0A212KMN7_9PROT|nr:Peptidase M20 [uncultured Alphaproteobacteria bacterium]